jgi:hypothetical protein
MSLFSDAVFSNIINAALAPTSPASKLEKTRLRHAAAPHASALIAAYYLPSDSQLTDPAAILHICHRLGLPIPWATQNQTHCHPDCGQYPPSHPFPHGSTLQQHPASHFHTLACAIDGIRSDRHDRITHIIARLCRKLLQASTNFTTHLSSSLTCGRKVDCIVFTLFLKPPRTAIDITISVPFVPSHLDKHGTHPAEHLFKHRANQKHFKHGDGCVALRAQFLPIVLSSLGGIGPPEALDWLTSLFANSYSTEYTTSRTAHHTADSRSEFHQAIAASLATSQAEMITRITDFTTPSKNHWHKQDAAKRATAAATAMLSAPPGAAPIHVTNDSDDDAHYDTNQHRPNTAHPTTAPAPPAVAT